MMVTETGGACSGSGGGDRGPTALVRGRRPCASCCALVFSSASGLSESLCAWLLMMVTETGGACSGSGGDDRRSTILVRGRSTTAKSLALWRFAASLAYKASTMSPVLRLLTKRCC